MAETSFPSRAPVIVIGGGVMGCSTLYHLAQHGVSDAVLIERNQLTSGTTWHSAAQVRALRSSRSLTDIIRYSIDLYSELERDTGQHTGWINKGSLSIATSSDRLIHIERQAALASLFAVRAERIGRAEAKERWPLMNDEDVIGAVWSPDDGRVSPSDLCAALVKGAKAKGARIFEKTAVDGVITKNGRISGLETTRGRIACDAVALCTGLWSRQMGAMAGVDVPVWPCEHFYLLTKPVDGITGNMPTLSDHDRHLYIRDDSGGLLIGCFEPLGKPIDPEHLGENFAFQLLDEDWEHFEPMMGHALHRLPALETAEVKMLLNGPEGFTPDGSFLLGEAAETPGLFLGCGMNSVGVASGGGAGMALAHCIQHGHMPADLHEVDPKRFASVLNNVDVLAERVPEVLGKHYEITFPGRQWTSARNLMTLPLDDQWRDASAHMGQIFGWERPLYFGKTKEPKLSFGRPDWFEQVRQEVRLAHEKAAIFDQSTFGKIEIKGRDACSFLNRLCANQVDQSPGRVIYTSMLNERGGIESDLTMIRLNDELYRLYVGTSSIKRDLAWLQRHRRADEHVAMTDCTLDYAVLGLMGPDAPAIADAVGAKELKDLHYFRACQSEIARCPILAARLSYVGEAGFEITCKAAHALPVYQALYQAGARPAGLFAQTSMRIEKKFLAYGHELDTDISPLQAGLGFSIAWDTDFIGRPSLLVQRDRGTRSNIISVVFRNPNAIPQGHEPILIDQKTVGMTTSASFGHRVGAPIALGSIHETSHWTGNGQGTVDIAGTLYDVDLVDAATFDPQGLRMKYLSAHASSTNLS